MTNPNNTTTPLTLSRSQDIPFDKLVLSARNVRHVQSSLSIEELAEDLARRTLLQSLSVRPLAERAGFYEVQAGGRRYRALSLLVKQGRLSPDTPIPCIVRERGLLEEDSLAENVQRQNLHPLDQFRAFQTLQQQGLGEEEIAARFFVTPAIVKQRLKLASVAPSLLAAYAQNAMTLEQLMAFTLCDDPKRQEEVWASVKDSFGKHPQHIRRLLTENSIPVQDARVQFVGLKAYEEAGGPVTRDLFSDRGEGWVEDAALLERLFTAKLEAEAHAIRAEGWKWVEVAPHFPYGHTSKLHRITGTLIPRSPDEEATYTALVEAKQAIERRYFNNDSDVELPDEIERKLIRLEERIDELDDRPVAYDPADKAKAGAFVSVSPSGLLTVERGFVKLEDEKAAQIGEGSVKAAPSSPAEEPEDEALKPLSDRLVMELTAQRTLALRDALAKDPDVAQLAALHALVLQCFYPYATDSCLELTLKNTGFAVQGPDLKTSPAAQAVDQRQANWQRQLPKQPQDLWDTLTGFDADSRTALFAHCVASSLNALREPWNKGEGRQRHADQLAHDLGLDLAASGWRPTAANYFGRIQKERIMAAVAEVKGEEAATLLLSLRKSEMAEQAERMLADTHWLPEILRTPEAEGTSPLAAAPEELPPAPEPEEAPSRTDDLPAFLTAA